MTFSYRLGKSHKNLGFKELALQTETFDFPFFCGTCLCLLYQKQFFSTFWKYLSNILLWNVAASVSDEIAVRRVSIGNRTSKKMACVVLLVYSDIRLIDQKPMLWSLSLAFYHVKTAQKKRSMEKFSVLFLETFTRVSRRQA